MPDESPMIQAVTAGDLDAVVRLLADDPAAGMQRATSGETAIQRAVYHGRRDLADRLLATRPKLDLGTACTVGDASALECDDPNEMSADGFRPLCLASAFGHPDLVRGLFAKGADPNLRSTALGGVAPLDAAVFGRQAEIVKLLLEHGADPNAAQSGGFRPLHGAAQNGDVASIRVLLAHGADATIKDDAGNRPLDYAVEKGHEDAAQSFC